MKKKYKIAFILGIRPDVIRAALILKHLRNFDDLETVFIWSGQHYSDNLKGIFFRELGVEAAEVDLGCGGETDAEVAASVISRLYPVLKDLQPQATVFLGDTNTVTGAVAAAQLNIPIVHIEGCMRSYDWRMPEEKYRSLIDHLSDVIYAYFPEYKEQGIREGLHPDRIVVVGNPIVDILDHYYFSQKDFYKNLATSQFFAERKIKSQEYYLLTCHRRENVGSKESLGNILSLIAAAPRPVFFPASYRTQKAFKEFGLSIPTNLMVVDPIGYQEMLALIVNSRGVITDSGTVVEETCVLQVPSVQMRKSTERPQVYDAKSSVKFDPAEPQKYPAAAVYKKLESLFGKTWVPNLGDGKTSQKIAQDLYARAKEGRFRTHAPELSHIPVERSFREDGL